MSWKYQMVAGIYPKSASLTAILKGGCNEDIIKAIMPWKARASANSIVMLDVGQKIEQKGKAANFVPLVTYILIKGDKDEGSDGFKEFKEFLEGQYSGTVIKEISMAEMQLLSFESDQLAKMKASELQALVADFAVSQHGSK